MTLFHILTLLRLFENIAGGENQIPYAGADLTLCNTSAERLSAALDM